MHSLGCSGAEGPQNIIFARGSPCKIGIELGGGGDKRRVSPANDSIAAAHIICDPAAKKNLEVLWIFTAIFCSV